MRFFPSNNCRGGDARWARKWAKRFVSARRGIPWNGDYTLPFVDNPFQHIVSSFSFHSLSLFCLRLETCTLKYRCTGLVESQQSEPGRSRSVPFFFLFFCLVSRDDFECSNERAGHTGHLYCFLLDAAVPFSSLAQPPHS